ncbi:hypothetical protein PMAYCL1PPCAC_01590, partial [Pristionchus mayeri]
RVAQSLVSLSQTVERKVGWIESNHQLHSSSSFLQHDIFYSRSVFLHEHLYTTAEVGRNLCEIRQIDTFLVVSEMEAETVDEWSR